MSQIINYTRYRARNRARLGKEVTRKRIESHKRNAIRPNLLSEKDWALDSLDILMGIKFFMKEHCFAFFGNDGNSLRLKFSNGQRFRITEEEL